MRVIWVVIPLILIGIIGIQESFAEELDLEYGEYLSSGNTWIELTYSAASPPPWLIDWRIANPGEYYPKDWIEIKLVKEIAEKFYKKFDIQILDVIRSAKNAQLCEAEYCLFGTYHLLIPNDDVDKFHKGGFGFIEFADSGITEPNAGGDGSLEANWIADFFLSTNGTLHLTLELDYLSKEMLNASYYGSGSRGEKFVDVDEFYFVDSFVFVSFPYGGSNANVIGLVADSESEKIAKVKLDTDLDYNMYSSQVYNYGSIGLGWVRLFVDSDGERYYQWMRSNTSEIFEMNEEYHTNGTFSVANLFPESRHRVGSFTFDYIEWLKEDYLKNKSPSEQIKSKAVRSYEVQCKEGLELIFKSSNNSPACVKPSTAEKLIQRGWASP